MIEVHFNTTINEWDVRVDGTLIGHAPTRSDGYELGNEYLDCVCV